LSAAIQFLQGIVLSPPKLVQYQACFSLKHQPKLVPFSVSCPAAREFLLSPCSCQVSFDRGAPLAGAAPSSPFDSPPGLAHVPPLPSPTAAPDVGRGGRGGISGHGGPAAVCGPSREPWGWWPRWGARGVPLSHRVPRAPRAWHSLVTAARLEPCPGSPRPPVAPASAVPVKPSVLTPRAGWRHRSGPQGQPSDFGRADAGLPLPGVLGRPRRLGTILLPGPSAGAGRWGGGSPASAASTDPL